ncbi:MAG: hypothetical protein HY329_07250 [Chloroflexi bacterium]|nr:hypothetical protein [Chloroflexota bacterium]
MYRVEAAALDPLQLILVGTVLEGTILLFAKCRRASSRTSTVAVCP